jgi:AhpD family alkylhydroperoxidase
MARTGEIDPLVKELIYIAYIAVSITNGCEYCISSHSAAARAKGISDQMFGELSLIFTPDTGLLQEVRYPSTMKE